MVIRVLNPVLTNKLRFSNEKIALNAIKADPLEKRMTRKSKRRNMPAIWIPQ